MSLSDDFDSIGATSQKTAPATAPAVAPIAATPAAPVAGAQAAPSLSAQFDATPTSAAKPDTPKPSATPSAAPAKGLHEETPLDIAGAAVEPLLSLGTAAIAQPVGWAARLASAALGNDYAGAKQAGDNITNALTYQPQTQGGQEAQNGLAQMAKGIGSAVMASPAGPVISGIGDAYNKQFVQGAPNAFMATVNNIVPAATANIAAGPLVGKASALVKGGNKLAALSAPEAAIAQNSLAAAARVEPTLAPEASPANAAPEVQPTAAPAKPNYRPNGDGTFTQTPPGASTVPPDVAPASAAPKATSSTQTPPTPVFEAPELPTPKTSLSDAEQQANIEAMNTVGLSSQRASAIAGDKFMAGTEYQQSKLDTPQGEVMRAQLGKEQDAVKGFAQNIVQETGATSGTPEAVGQSIRAPLQGLSDHYDNAISSLYQTADQRAGGAPSVELNALPKLLADPDFRETLMAKNQQGLLDSVGRQLDRFQGASDARNIGAPEGSVGAAPNTVASAEKFRQWLNSVWSPDNSATIGKMKEALDTDVMKSAGEDTYAAARVLHAERKNTLDNPNGIASLLNQDGPGGINQAVPDEKVAPKMLAMPTNQFSHVVDTLNSLPDHLAPQGQQAIAEVKGALAQKIYQAGDNGGTQNGASVWNAAKVTKALNANASKMALVFTPEEIAQFQALNRAGHILQTPSAYPGAAVQGHNLVQKGLIYAPSVIGGAIGGHVGGMLGSIAGSAGGNALSRKLAQAADMRAANALQKMLSNPKVIREK